ncbi:MAG: diguanylate cyclase [Phormidesmis sp.]
MNSVLLVGSDRFCTSVIAQVRSLDVLKVMSTSAVSTAVEMMEVSLPDVIIVQVCCLEDGSVNKTFGAAYNSPYYVLIEEPGQLISKQDNGNDRRLKPLTMKRVAYSVDQLSELYTEEKAIALESGADAYLWRLSDRGSALPSACLESESLVAMPEAGQLVSNAVSNGASLVPQLSFRKSQQRLIQAHIHIGLNRAQRYRDLSRINDWLSAVALADSLTQLSNRRAFDMELPRQVRVALAKSRPLSLMVIDIDYFKRVNDRHGHLVGDDVLKQLAQRFLSNMRFYDTSFRYGGEEFVVTLGNTELEEGWTIAERLRHSIERTPFKLHALANGLEALNVTVSIGLTQLRFGDDESGASFLHRADQNLLRAKATGRNRVVSDE